MTGTDIIDEWSISADPLFAYSLGAVRDLAMENALEPFEAVAAIDPAEWVRFYQVQAAYLLTCSVLERIAYFSFGSRVGPTA